jgi:hypothetical protein
MLAVMLIVVILVVVRVGGRDRRAHLALVGEAGRTGGSSRTALGNPSLQLGAHDFDQFFGPLSAFPIGIIRRIGDVEADVILHDLGHEAVHGAACGSHEVHDFGAAFLPLERTFDGFGSLLSGPWMRWILGISFFSVAVWALFPDR